jgi:hypothetical protein
MGISIIFSFMIYLFCMLIICYIKEGRERGMERGRGVREGGK